MVVGFYQTSNDDLSAIPKSNIIDIFCTKQILIPAIFLVIFSVVLQFACAELESLTPLELYNSSELILVGEVVSLREDPLQYLTEYDIKVEQYLKNPKPYNLITVVGSGTKSAPGEDDPIFDQGDRVLLYLNKYNEKYHVRPFSFKAPLTCDKHQLLRLAAIPGDPRSISSPANDSIHLTNTFGSETDTFVVNEEININYDLINNNPLSNNIVPTITIMTDSAKVFHAKQSVPLEPCTQSTISWNFTPTNTGEYTVNVASRDISASIDFHVRLYRSGVSLDKDTFQSPLKQFKSGIDAGEVICKEGLMLVTKARDDSPACVKPLTYNKLVERGWVRLQGIQTTFYVYSNDTKYEISYHVTGWKNKILNMTLDLEAKSLLVTMQTKNKGELTVTLPRYLLDSNIEKTEAIFFVLVDGEEVEIKNETRTDTARTITIVFQQGTRQIEIIGATLI